MLQKIYVSNKWFSFEVSINQRILKKVKTVFTKRISSSAGFILDKNKKCFLSSKTAYYIYQMLLSKVTYSAFRLHIFF